MQNTESPRDMILKSIKIANVNGRREVSIDHESIIEVLSGYRRFVDSDSISTRREENIKAELDLSNYSEEMLNEPYEKARKIALLVDCCNLIGHSAKKNFSRYCFLMAMKDILIESLAIHCIENGIPAGLSRDDKSNTFIADIPTLGQIGWHLGNKKDHNPNTNGLKKSAGSKLGHYTGIFIIKESETDSFRYSNGDLLLGKLHKEDLNIIDKRLAYGSRSVPKSTPPADMDL